MTTKIDPRKKQEVRSPQDNPIEIIERWKQSKVVNRTRQYPEGVAEDASTSLQANLTKAVQFISLIGGLVTLLFVARIGLKIIAVNPGTPFGRFVVGLTDLFLWPFSSMTETLSAPHVTMLELSSLTAVILYPFAAWSLIRLLQHIFPQHKA